MSDEEQKAYARGYAAGRKKLHDDIRRARRAAERARVMNERLTTLTAVFLTSYCAGGWTKTINGVRKPLTLAQMKKDAVQDAQDIVNEMRVYE